MGEILALTWAGVDLFRRIATIFHLVVEALHLLKGSDTIANILMKTIYV